VDFELERLLANKEPFICSYAEDDDPGAGGDPAPEPEPGPDPAPEPEPPAEPPAPEPPPPPPWALELQESVKQLQERLSAPEPEPEPAPVSDEDLDKPLTKRELQEMIARASSTSEEQRAEERVLQHCKTALKAEYPDIVVKDPVTGVESLNPKYSKAVTAFYTKGDSGHVFEAALRRISPPAGGAAPAPAPEDDAILDSPAPASDPKPPSYKDANSLDEIGRMVDKGG